MDWKIFTTSITGEVNGTPLQYSCLENPMDRGAWWAAVHGVVKSQTRLSDFTFNFHFHASEKEMSTHSSDLAWRIPGMAEPDGLLSMGLHRIGHDWSNLAAAAAVLLERWIFIVRLVLFWTFFILILLSIKWEAKIIAHLSIWWLRLWIFKDKKNVTLGIY